jgi:AcrR family transcriptional regulator
VAEMKNTHMKLTKKQQIELKAKELFWKHGFKKVTIDEICKKANVSRKTFYTYYENKTALVIFILQEMSKEIKAVYARMLEDDMPFALKMEKMLALKLKMSESLSMEFMADFYNPDAQELLECFNKMKEDSLAITMDFFSKAQQKGEMNPHLDLNYVMWMMQRVMEQCSSPELLALFPTAESMTRQISESILYGIMPVKSSHS